VKTYRLANGFEIPELSPMGPMVRLPWGVDPENRFTYGRVWVRDPGYWQEGWPLHRLPLDILAGGLQAVVDLGFTYRTAGGEHVTVPCGLVSDGASVPRYLWPFYPPWGDGVNNYALAVVIHDWLFAHRQTDEHRALSRLECDGIMYEAMAYLGCSEECCNAFKLAVDACGWCVWNDRAAEDIL